MSLARAKVIVNLISIQIVVVPQNISDKAFKLVKRSGLKFFEIDLNTIPQTKIFDVCYCILIELVYCVLINHIKVSYVKV